MNISLEKGLVRGTEEYLQGLQTYEGGFAAERGEEEE